MAQVTVEIQHWLLSDPQAMTTCLEDMSAQNFRGQVRVTPVAEPNQEPVNVWDMELNDNAHLDRPAVNAPIGQVVVFFAGVLQTMSAADYQEQFGEAP
jgi:hypothetical protein